MDQNLLYEKLNGKLSLKDCKELSPYCEVDKWDDIHINNYNIGYCFCDLIGTSNIEYMEKQDYSKMLYIHGCMGGFDVILKKNLVCKNLVKSLIEDLESLSRYPFLDEDDYYRKEDELREEAIEDFINIYFNDGITENKINLINEYVMRYGSVENFSFYFDEKNCLEYVIRNSNPSEKTA